MEEWDDLIVVVAFDDIIKRSVLDRLDAIRDIAIRGQQDNFRLWLFFFDDVDEVDAVAVRKFDITQHGIKLLLLHLFYCGFAITGLDDVKTFQADQPGQQGTKFFFVVDEQDGFQLP